MLRPSLGRKPPEPRPPKKTWFMLLTGPKLLPYTFSTVPGGPCAGATECTTGVSAAEYSKVQLPSGPGGMKTSGQLQEEADAEKLMALLRAQIGRAHV